MIRNNAIANFLGRIFPSVIGIVVVPIYIKYMGVESYGLISFVLAMQGAIAFLDMGLGTVINKEIAAGAEHTEKSGELLRTFEVVYFGIALLIAGGFLLGSDWISQDWIKNSQLSSETITFAVDMAGLNIALRWPIALYTGVMMGLQKHVRLNAVTVFLAIFRNLLTVVVVVAVSSTIVAYMVVQLIASFVEMAVMYRMAWLHLEADGRKHKEFRFEIIKRAWKFCFSLTVVALLAGVLKQFDRIVITNAVSLEATGYYGVAYVVYRSLLYLVSPLVDASFPRFSALLASGTRSELAEVYHRISQVVSFVTLPAALFVVLFSHQILMIWTHSPVLAQETSLTLSILALAFAFNAMMHLPMAAQYAAGVTSISVATNVLGVIFCVPLTYVLVQKFGVAGAGVAWLAFNICRFLFTPYFMHRRVLRGEQKAWFFQDTLPFMGLAALFLVGGWAVCLRFGDLAAFGAFCVGGLAYVFVCYRIYPSVRLLVSSVLRIAFRSLGKAET